jgi:hypothetical protein
MLTPAYALTATERVLPRMALDFTTGVLDPRVTVARLLDTATRVTQITSSPGGVFSSSVSGRGDHGCSAHIFDLPEVSNWHKPDYADLGRY